MKTLLAFLILAPLSFSANAGIGDVFHTLTCNAFLAARPSPEEMARLSTWLNAEVPRSLDGDFEIHYSEPQEDAAHERWVHRGSEKRKKRVYAAFAEGRDLNGDDADASFHWAANIMPSDWYLQDRDLKLVPFLDRLEWTRTGSSPTGGEFMIFVIEHNQFADGALAFERGTDALKVVVERARLGLPDLDRVERVVTEDYHNTRTSYLRLISRASTTERLRTLLEFDRRLKKEIRAYPTFGESRRHRGF